MRRLWKTVADREVRRGERGGEGQLLTVQVIGRTRGCIKWEPHGPKEEVEDIERQLQTHRRERERERVTHTHTHTWRGGSGTVGTQVVR